ncbi:MAG: tRNA 2-thiouridine(34) synthase MnmA [Myxococcota bacterium]
MARVVVAMSGGVDSSVAAALLVEQGHDVIGVHMKLHDAAPGSEPGTCCGLDDAVDARLVADGLGIPFYVMNLREAFKRAVMDDLADTYLAGRTPNPCIQCNGVLKFKVLMARAVALGASHLATGHYAQVLDGPTLHRAVDPAKDQSYFLFPITMAALERTIFPLGGMHKEEVREHARRFGLNTAEKPESQDVCFLPDADHARYIAEVRPEAEMSGEIVDESGRVLGYHDGYVQYTVGQRRGLGLSLGHAAYVQAIDTETRRVIVAPKHRVEHRGLIASSANWFDRPDPTEVVLARIRHRGALTPCIIGEGDSFKVELKEPVFAASPGQAVVFYRGDRVLGGAWIDKALDAWLPDHMLNRSDDGAERPSP